MELTISQVKAVLLSMSESEKVTPFQIQRFFDKFLINKPIPAIEITHEFVLRCSQNSYSEKEDSNSTVFRNISRCSYNPDVNSIGLQRCNYPEQQVFYAALPSNSHQVSALMTSILEVSLSHAKNKEIARQYYTISKWRLNKSLKVFTLPFSKRSCKRNKDFKLMNNEYKERLKSMCKNNKAFFLYMESFLEFMSNVFCKAGKKINYYKISSAFFNSLIKFSNNKSFKTLDDSEKKLDWSIDGIIYPSASSKAEGMNICLQKHIVDDKLLQCDSVMMYKMERHPTDPKQVFHEPASREVKPNEFGDLTFPAIW